MLGFRLRCWDECGVVGRRAKLASCRVQLGAPSPCRLQGFLDDAEEGASGTGVGALLGAGGGDFGD